MISSKICCYCGKEFYPDIRIGDKQKSCFDKICKNKRKMEAQNKWVKKNLGYFKGRYSNKKQWLESHTGYLKEYRQKKRIEKNKNRINIRRHKQITSIQEVVKLFSQLPCINCQPIYKMSKQEKTL